MLTDIYSFSAFSGHCPGRMADQVEVNKSLTLVFTVVITAIVMHYLGCIYEVTSFGK